MVSRGLENRTIITGLLSHYQQIDQELEGRIKIGCYLTDFTS